MKLQLKKYFLNFIAIVFLISFLFSACQKSLTREQSEKHLKAFDSELIMLIKQVSETNAFKAFEALPSLSKLPLPFNYPEKDETGNPIAFNLEQKKGIYQYNNKLDELIRCGESDSIVILFPFYTKNDTVAKFIVSDYQEEMSIWGVMVPTVAQMKIVAAKKTLFNLQIKSEMAYQVPVECEISASFDKFNLAADLKTKLSKTKARIKVNAQIFKREEEYLAVNAGIVTKITDQNSMVFDKVKIQGNVYPISFEAKVNYGNINLGSHHFVNDFNDNSSIRVYTHNNEHLGNIKLKERENCDRLNFVVEYNDKSFSYLEDFILTYNEIMNIKM